MQDAHNLSDHYEALQISPNADTETVDRVYRMLAKRYHPDNRQTGDEAKFRAIVSAHRVLSDPEQRAAYDVKYDEHRGTALKIAHDASSSDGFSADQRIFEAILSLLYISRRRDAQHGGMGILQLERMIACPAKHLEFHIWYLLEKGSIQRLDNGQFSITA